MNSNNNAQNGSSLGRSVVPDLMRVYESLTQSSTPQESDNQTHHSQIPQPQSYPQDPGNYPKNTSTPTPNPQFLPPDNYAAMLVTMKHMRLHHSINIIRLQAYLLLHMKHTLFNIATNPPIKLNLNAMRNTLTLK